MQKKYFIQQYLQQEYLHGGIGFVDAERILLSEGYTPILFPHQQNFSLPAKISRLFYLFKIVFQIQKGSVVIFLFPMYAKMVQLLIKLLLLRRNIRLICFITDIDGIKDGNPQKLEEDISFFRTLKYFIVHNHRMQQWLNSKVKGANSAEIVFFDFLTKPVEITRKLSRDIVFAGNLEKSSFLEKLYLLKDKQPALHFNLYGSCQTDSMLQQTNATWHGVERPYDLPQKLQGSFGLLWDGSSIDEPGGSLGDYMQYISHHKLSLYILSGLPVIVPAISGTAGLVKEYKIGITIKSLYEIEDKIKSITNDEYQQMKKNMQPLAEKISTGGCIKEALQKIMPDV
ncbi:MAG TPA: hypothetical protein VJ111_14900 [Chitinophagaceae bacterium]|nr:hypothetical protein [Chitinophagaceae bacterium]